MSENINILALKISGLNVATLRAFYIQHRQLACWLIGASLLAKALIPAGFMPGFSSVTLVLQLCTGQGGQTVLMEVATPRQDYDDKEHQKAKVPCMFSVLSVSAPSLIDPILLALAIAFILTIAIFERHHRVIWPSVYLRPPSQGPPSLS